MIVVFLSNVSKNIETYIDMSCLVSFIFINLILKKIYTNLAKWNIYNKYILLNLKECRITKLMD